MLSEEQMRLLQRIASFPDHWLTEATIEEAELAGTLTGLVKVWGWRGHYNMRLEEKGLAALEQHRREKGEV